MTEELDKLRRLLDEQSHALQASRQRLQSVEAENLRLQTILRLQEQQIFAIDQHTIASASNRAGDIVYANDRFVDICGYSREELLGASHRIVNSGVHPPELFRDMWRTISSGQVWKGEVCNRHKNGSLYWVNATIVPFLDESGRPYQYFSVRTDITPLKQAQRSLQQTVVDLGERVKEWTCLNAVTQALQDDALSDAQALSAVVGLIPPGWLVPASTCARVRWGDLVCTSPHFFESPWRQVAQLSSAHRQVEVEVFRQPVEGVDKPFLPEEQTLLDSIAMQIGQAMERREAQRELRIARDAAEATSLAKGAFLANMSHEIRTPMNGIIGMSQLALEAPSDNERREHMLIVKQSAESLLDIINDILDFSKIEAGKLALEQVPFDLRASVELGLHALRMRAQEKGLVLTCRVDQALPRQVVGDPTRLRQVLVNLIGNAIKFTARGEVVLDIGWGPAMATGILLRFTVRDTGIGIAPDKLESIFDAFSQADTSTTRQYGGTGLGLTITQRLVTLMGGQLRVQSQTGQGTTFDVLLPMGLSDAEATAAPVKGPQAVDAPHIAASLRVLLVEDHPVNQKLAKHLLQRWGHQVTLAHNGQEALDAVGAGQPFDLLLMDMQMPVMDGIEATRHIRTLEALKGWPAVPIIAMTANAMQGDRDDCLAAGMNDYLSKPMRPDELSDKLALWAPTRPSP
ncbi:PAS domain-containing hybrid sensor histidine kinase/response regulator [Hydrogenophaga atypica]|uniref:histidine kinase n=1 Tax=Hydrogenophaga atypica TaxID=249409 RepID=A0ABW2QL86_9BURK